MIVYFLKAYDLYVELISSSYTSAKDADDWICFIVVMAVCLCTILFLSKSLSLYFFLFFSNYFIWRIKLKCIILQKFISGLNDILWIFDKLRMQTINRKVQTSSPSARNAVTVSFLSRRLHNWLLNLSFLHSTLTKQQIRTNIAKYTLQVNKHWKELRKEPLHLTME